MREQGRTRWLASAALVTMAWSTSARAQTVATPGFALNRFEPAERGSEWFANDTLDLRGKLRPAIGITADYGYHPYVLLNPDGSQNTSVVADQLFLHAGGALVIADRLRLAFSLPIALTEGGTSTVHAGQSYVAPDGAGVGDLRLAADVRLYGTYGGLLTVAAGVRAWLPTGAVSQDLGDGDLRIGPHLSVAGDAGQFAYAASLGIIYRGNSQGFDGHPIGTETEFSLAAGLRTKSRKLLIGPELWGSTAIANGATVFDARTSPVALLVSGHGTVGDFIIGLGAGPGLSSAAGTAAFRALASVDWTPAVVEDKPALPGDRDADGVLDPDDACPDVPGVRTDDPKTNGCPADRDKDGIADAQDACPDVPGVKTDDPKTNGCPADRDKDGIVDSEDACPDVPGVKTDDPKTNGCPSDRDKDGIADAQDACPDVPGVKTDDPKTNGCPGDRDKDGIIDNEDACPDAPGPKSSDPKKNGCPMARVENGQVKITDQIKFKTGSAVILKESQPIIDAVSKVMKDHPEIKHVRVEGHTDDRGAAKMNRDLSKRRAASVVAALVKAGIARDHLTSDGFGPDKPIDTNGTDAGRANNRRVEFHIEDEKK